MIRLKIYLLSYVDRYLIILFCFYDLNSIYMLNTISSFKTLGLK